MSLANIQIEDNQIIALSKNLNRSMLEGNIDSKTLSQITGISINTINALKRGEGNPTLGTLFSLAKFFNCSIDTLVGIGDKKPIKAGISSIPVYNLVDAEKRDKNSIIEYIMEDCGNFKENELFAVQIHSDIFSPFFEKDSIFIVSKDMKYTDGDLVLLALKDNSVLIRKIFSINDNEIIFSSISMTPEFNKYRKHHIIGVVIKVIHSFY